MPSKPQLLIRADASPDIGAGHVMRSLAIAQAWQDLGGEATYVSTQLPDPLRSRLLAEGFGSRMIMATTGSQTDAEELMKISQEVNAHAVALDGYTFDEDYHARLAGSRQVSLTIDDNAHLGFYQTDFVLNQNAGASDALYSNRSPTTELMLGTKYALLRREFVSSPARSGGMIDTWRILVTLGASDPTNTTQIVVEGLKQLESSDLEVCVVAGAMNPNLGTIVKSVESDGRFSIHHDVRDMSKWYRWANLAVAAGGSSNWEMCFFGLPRILLVIAGNQSENARELESAEIAINLGDAADLTPHAIRDAVDRLEKNPEGMETARRNAMALVDGNGATRCVQKLLDARKFRDNHASIQHS